MRTSGDMEEKKQTVKRDPRFYIDEAFSKIHKQFTVIREYVRDGRDIQTVNKADMRISKQISALRKALGVHHGDFT